MSERLVFVYKSHNKQGRYLYLKEKDVFSHIPAALLDAFGTPEFVMMFALSKHKTLPKVSVEDLDNALEEKGYNPINQIVGYILSGDPTYITSHNGARNLIRQVERDELLEEMVKNYIGLDK